jgi:hypothetical protein
VGSNERRPRSDREVVVNFSRSRDSNEKPIVEALRSCGASVTLLGDSGVPDLLVGFRGRTLLLEVKLPLGAKGGKSQRRECEGGRGDMTKAQVAWWDSWKGESAIVVRSVEEALSVLGIVGAIESWRSSRVPRFTRRRR